MRIFVCPEIWYTPNLPLSKILRITMVRPVSPVLRDSSEQSEGKVQVNNEGQAGRWEASNNQLQRRKRLFYTIILLHNMLVLHVLYIDSVALSEELTP